MVLLISKAALSKQMAPTSPGGDIIIDVASLKALDQDEGNTKLAAHLTSPDFWILPDILRLFCYYERSSLYSPCQSCRKNGIARCYTQHHRQSHYWC
ncbi:MAG: hypothetical protein IPL35_04510 [Sphingobacteriales bacterium]|nr:hypothetical protein [Sphingobacteriales bacterium]